MLTRFGLERRHEALFDALDVNADCSIELKELEAVLGPDAENFLLHLDTINTDGVISLEEFKRWVNSKGAEFKDLNRQIQWINSDAYKGTFNLYSMVAGKLDEARQEGKNQQRSIRSWFLSL